MEGYVTQRQYDELLQVFQDVCSERGVEWLVRATMAKSRVYTALRRCEAPQLYSLTGRWRCSDCHQNEFHTRECETAQLLGIFGPADEAERQARCAWSAALREAARRAGPRAVPRADGGTNLVWADVDDDG